ncbi:GPALPP motifs-containing protein 1-like [Acanthaster planci]|uniref:GPALPP motifs-containing protein 1-like n=1 Tax=Acanthaster planci TaxID=133434 RepID=A0A8B7ZXH7_ACAPL|nr:GPALPP motifs-containing protein 1-like [Acanthaster planci]
MSDSSDCDIGPALPPHMRAASKGDRASGPEESRMEGRVTFRPVLPPHLSRSLSPEGVSSLSARPDEQCEIVGPSLSPDTRTDAGRTDGSSSPSICPIGPVMPPRLNTSDKGEKLAPEDSHDQEDSDPEDSTYGPALPPGFATSKRPSDKPCTIGPALPPGFRKTTAEDDGDVDPEGDEVSEDESSDEEEVIGPMLPADEGNSFLNTYLSQLSGLHLCMEQIHVEDVAPARDSWMTELPEFSKNFGLGPRTFRKSARPDEQDRSGWTETPADRARKHQERMEKAAAQMLASSSSKDVKEKKQKKEGRGEKKSERDKRLAQQVAQHNQTTRPESLMEMHTKSRKRKLAEGGLKEQERRPFDRETDLQVNRFDEARRKQLLKKSANLGDKFSHSNEKMYL